MVIKSSKNEIKKRPPCLFFDAVILDVAKPDTFLLEYHKTSNSARHYLAFQQQPVISVIEFLQQFMELNLRVTIVLLK